MFVHAIYNAIRDAPSLSNAITLPFTPSNGVSLPRCHALRRVEARGVVPPLGPCEGTCSPSVPRHALYVVSGRRRLREGIGQERFCREPGPTHREVPGDRWVTLFPNLTLYP